MLELDETSEAGVTVLSPWGRLDSDTSPKLGVRLDALAQTGHGRLVLDLGGIDFVSSAGLRVILAAMKKAQAAQGRFALCSLQPAVQEVLEIAGFSSLLSVHPGRGEALEAMA